MSFIPSILRVITFAFLLAEPRNELPLGRDCNLEMAGRKGNKKKKKRDK